VHRLEDPIHLRLRLADGETPDAESLPVAHVADGTRRLDPQVGVDAALDDGKQGLVRAVLNRLLAVQVIEGARAARQPAHAPLTRVARRGRVALAGNDVIELHDDIGAEVALDAHHALGSEAAAGAVDVAAEVHPVLVDGAQPL
jgi:hypothetical protein